ENARGALIREEQRYGGVRIQMTALLDRARIPIQIDIGFGDIVTPRAEQVEYPSLLAQAAPVLGAYPMVTAVAEKYEALVSLGIANSRMKDFYDLWLLARDFEFDGAILARAIKATFERRATALPAIVPMALTSKFSEEKVKQ